MKGLEQFLVKGQMKRKPMMLQRTPNTWRFSDPERLLDCPGVDFVETLRFEINARFVLGKNIARHPSKAF